MLPDVDVSLQKGSERPRSKNARSDMGGQRRLKNLPLSRAFNPLLQPYLSFGATAGLNAGAVVGDRNAVLTRGLRS